MISVIIPTLNEEKHIEVLLQQVTALSGAKEIIVADGGSTDNTTRLAAPYARVISCLAGRGTQLNAGAQQATGDILFFLHADSSLEQNVLQKITRAIEQGSVWGCLKLRFDEKHLLTRLIALLSNLRVRWRGLAYGDQGIFMTRRLFEQIGGLPNLALMEDYELSLRLKKLCIAPMQVDSCIISSARRFRNGGRLRVWLQMWQARRLYRSPKQALILFTRLPIPGQVKTRLMPQLSGEQCAALQWALLEDLAPALRDTAADLFVFYTPEDRPDELRRLQELLGPAKYIPQQGQDLGRRMQAAFELIFQQGYNSCLLLGSDIPLIGSAEISAAWELLNGHDVVFGPSADGGYWLVGLKQPCPALFWQQSYGHGGVLAQAREICSAQGLSICLAATRRDIDTWEDLEYFRLL